MEAKEEFGENCVCACMCVFLFVTVTMLCGMKNSDSVFCVWSENWIHSGPFRMGSAQT